MDDKIQKAIDILEKPSKHIQCVHKCENGMQFLAYSQDLVAAFETAVDALERLIPKKPTGISQVKGELLSIGKCPNCGSIIGEDSLWCDNCGQKIYWE